MKRIFLKGLCSLKANGVNYFEASLSVVWSNLEDLVLNQLEDLELLKLYVNIPVYINLQNGTLHLNTAKCPGKTPRKQLCLINKNLVEIAELKCNLSNLKRRDSTDKSLKWSKSHEDSTIELFDLNHMFLVGAWKLQNVINHFLIFFV